MTGADGRVGVGLSGMANGGGRGVVLFGCLCVGPFVVVSAVGVRGMYLGFDVSLPRWVLACSAWSLTSNFIGMRVCNNFSCHCS